MTALNRNIKGYYRSPCAHRDLQLFISAKHSVVLRNECGEHLSSLLWNCIFLLKYVMSGGCQVWVTVVESWRGFAEDKQQFCFTNPCCSCGLTEVFCSPELDSVMSLQLRIYNNASVRDTCVWDFFSRWFKWNHLGVLLFHWKIFFFFTYLQMMCCKKKSNWLQTGGERSNSHKRPGINIYF